MGACCSSPRGPAESRRAAAAEKEYQMQQIVDKVMEILRTANEPGLALRTRIGDTVGTKGWTEDIARRILTAMEQFIQQGDLLMGQGLHVAINASSKTVLDIFNFPVDHPHAVVATVVAIGVLVILAPYVIEMLGFGELGPLEGTQHLQIPRILWRWTHTNDRQAHLRLVGRRCMATFRRLLSSPSSKGWEWYGFGARGDWTEYWRLVSDRRGRFYCISSLVFLGRGTAYLSVLISRLKGCPGGQFMLSKYPLRCPPQ
jgi:hypothetical protein